MPNLKVLVVDDERIVCDDVSEILQANGYEVIGISDSGREAIELARKNPPGLLIMDVKLKGDLNGIETTIVIQGELDKPIPTVFLTAFNLNEFPYLHVVYHCTHLNKPFTAEQLLKCIENVLGNQPDFTPL